MAQIPDIELLDAMEKKIEKNSLKYPAEKINGKHLLD